MPVVRIFVDEPHWEKVKANVASLGTDIHQLLTEKMKAHPDSCQILFTQALMPNQVPSVYVDFQYRSSAERTKEIVQQAADHITELLSNLTESHCRTRAFAIDVAMLVAAERGSIRA